MGSTIWKGENMRKVVVLVAAALTLAVLVPAQADARHNIAHRVKVLEGKVKALQTRTNALYSFTHDCLAWDWVPLASYGDWTAPYNEFGYDWRQPDGTTFYTTALDYADPNSADFFAPAINPACRTQVATRAARLRAEVSELSGGEQKYLHHH
jgi:hypothetical protein